MKIGVLSFAIACMTALITYKVFRDFQNRWKEAETFQNAVLKAPLSVKHLLIPPEQLGIGKWHPGDYTAYQLKTNTENKQVSFFIAAQASGGSEQHWLRTDGLLQFNATNIAVWTLQTNVHFIPVRKQMGFVIQGTLFFFPSFLQHFHNILFILRTEAMNPYRPL